MKSWVGTAASALVSGTVASLAMTASVALLAKKGKRALQPINSTSHWLHGEEAASVRAMDMSHTRDAAAMSAAAIDYGITPKRATPGWEELLRRAPSARPTARWRSV